MEIEDSINNARAMIGWDRPIEIQDDSDLRKYRIELPNLYDDAGLDPYEFRLLAHYKRVGTCTESTRTTAKICEMGVMTVSEKRQSLNDKGFISLKTITLKTGGYSFIVTVVDKWQENFLKYGPRTPGVQARTPQRDKESSSSGDPQNIFTVYMSEIGVLTSFIADGLNDWSKSVPEEWVIASIREAAKQNKRNWKYCEAILKRWQAQGFMDDGKPKLSKDEEYENALQKAGYR
jgi:DnaD/phage-associated family protein